MLVVYFSALWTICGHAIHRFACTFVNAKCLLRGWLFSKCPAVYFSALWTICGDTLNRSARAAIDTGSRLRNWLRGWSLFYRFRLSRLRGWSMVYRWMVIYFGALRAIRGDTLNRSARSAVDAKRLFISFWRARTMFMVFSFFLFFI